jgi:putative MATE family efflux protein
MFGTGGSAIVSLTLGEGDSKMANEYFSFITYFAFALCMLLAVICCVNTENIAEFLGAEGIMKTEAVKYGRILFLSMPAYALQYIFQCFTVTAEKPKLGLYVTVISGCTNMILDWLFVGEMKMGVAGAALASATGQIIGAVIPLIYFLGKNTSLIHLTKTEFMPKVLLKVCSNGASELMTNVSLSLVNILYNFQLMKLAGENGVSAYGVIMYVNFIFISVFVGYSIGTAPIIGYNYGAGNYSELKNMFKKNMIIMGISGVLLMCCAISVAGLLSGVFVGYDEQLYALTKHGFTLYSLCFVFAGYNINASSFFTSLNNGFISAVISFLRTLVFQIICVVVLPIFLHTDGIWLSIVVSEILSLMVSLYFLISKRKVYKYL